MILRIERQAERIEQNEKNGFHVFLRLASEQKAC